MALRPAAGLVLSLRTCVRRATCLRPAQNAPINERLNCALTIWSFLGGTLFTFFSLRLWQHPQVSTHPCLGPLPPRSLTTLNKAFLIPRAGCPGTPGPWISAADIKHDQSCPPPWDLPPCHGSKCN